MSKRLLGVLLAPALFGVPVVGAADELAGQQQLLCSSVHATVCNTDGDCKSQPPWTLDIPQFVEVNLKDKVISTTRASGENRSTSIHFVERERGQIFFQGVENGRAFSFVLQEDTGMASIAVASEGKTVSVFGACTPLPAAK